MNKTLYKLTSDTQKSVGALSELAYETGLQDGLIKANALNALKPFDNTSMRWIPCSERMPDTNGVYNVTRKISDGFVCRNISDTCYYDGSNTWHDDTRVNHERRYITDVIAWMPLPKPYGGEQE